MLYPHPIVIKFEYNVNVFKKIINILLQFYKTYVMLGVTNNISPDSSVGRAVD